MEELIKGQGQKWKWLGKDFGPPVVLYVHSKSTELEIIFIARLEGGSLDKIIRYSSCKTTQILMPIVISAALGDWIATLLTIVARAALDDSYCCWTEINCVYDGMISFLRPSASRGDKHRWITGGLLNVHSFRISTAKISSTPIIHLHLTLT